jgi:poly(A) polymerase
VAAELMRLLLADEPAPVLLAMRGEGILAPILPEAVDFGRLRVLAWLERRGLVRDEIAPDALRRLAALLGPDRAAAEAVAARLRLSRVQAERLAAMAAPAIAPDPGLDGPARRRALRRIGAAAFRDATLLAWAGRRSLLAHSDHAETERWIGLLDDARAWQPVTLPVRGRDLLALGLAPGPGIGRRLAELEAWWEAEDYRPGRQECLDRLRHLAGSPMR